VIEWFIGRLRIVRYGSNASHAMAHRHFPEYACTLLSCHEIIALKRLFRAELNK
jgi:hypothetical protein